MDQHSDDLCSAIASYLPDRQIITFSEEMMVFRKDGSSYVESPRIFSYFFHEWIHYVHNVSTLHGISAFSSLIGLWNAFRFTTNEFGLGQGEFKGGSADTLKTKSIIDVLVATRYPTAGLVSSTASLDLYKITACEIVEEMSEDQNLLNVTVRESNAGGEFFEYKTTIGPTEILESVAYLLESRLLTHAFGQERSTAPVFPYQSLTLLGKHLAPNLNEKELLLCGLASLQSTFPASELFKFLSRCCELLHSGQDVESWLKQITIESLRNNDAQVRAGLDEMHAMFPEDRGVSKAVRATVSYMRKNIDIRHSEPFFELNIIEEIRIAGSDKFNGLMTNLMEKHGICSCRQERPGVKDAIEKDVLFNFSVVGKDDLLNDSRLIMLASFDHLIGHMQRNGNFLRTENMKNRCCPFFTSCMDSIRKEHPDECEKRPWRSIIIRSDNLCTYAAGVKVLSASNDVRDRAIY